jgi:thiamine monophosphate synthase
VANAAQEGADFAVFGPVWETPGKKAQGMAALHEATQAASLPAFAIGGVTPPRAKRAVNAGAHGVACIRSILGSENPSAAALEMWQAISG